MVRFLYAKHLPTGKIFSFDYLKRFKHSNFRIVDDSAIYVYELADVYISKSFDVITHPELCRDECINSIKNTSVYSENISIEKLEKHLNNLDVYDKLIEKEKEKNKYGI